MKHIFKLVLFLLLTVSTAYGQYCGLASGNACGGVDNDGDGYTTDGSGEFSPAIDCDDSDWQMYPGIWRFSGGQYSKCQSTGSYSSGVAQPTEATGSGQDFFVDCDAVTDGDGSFASPWNTTQHFTYFFVSQQPPVYHTPTAGDAFWIKGTCDVGYDYDGVGTGDSSLTGLYLRTSSGTAANKIFFIKWPGASVAFDQDGTTMTQGIYIRQTSYIVVSGMEAFASGQSGTCASSSESNHIEFRNNNFHNCTGTSGNNIAGLKLTDVDDTYIHHNQFVDNFDVLDPSGQNNRNLVFFQGTRNVESYNWNGYTDAAVLNQPIGQCTGTKHGDSSGNASVYDSHRNIYFSCATAVGGGMAGMHIYDNFMGVWSKGVTLENLGGPFYPSNLLMEYNTVVGPQLIGIDFTSYYATPTNNVIRRNVIEANVASYGGSNGIVTDTNFGTSADYAVTSDIGVIDYQNNCYWNTGAAALQFTHYAGGTAPEGGVYSFANWKLVDVVAPNNKPAWDDNSYEEDPLLDTYSRATSANCSDKGWLVGTSAIIPTVTALVTADTTPELNGLLGTANPAATVSVTVDGNVYAATNNADGTWTLADGTITPALAIGTYDVDVTVTDGGDMGSDLTTNELTIQSAPTGSVVDWIGSFLHRLCRGCF